MASKSFEVARLMMVQAARNGGVEPACGFAWANRLYPAFRESRVAETFADDFTTPKEKVISVARLIDELSEAKDGDVLFYSLEARLVDDDEDSLTRSQLIDCCRYIFLSNRFNKKVWTNLTKPGSGPVESQSLAKPGLDPAWDLPFDL